MGKNTKANRRARAKAREQMLEHYRELYTIQDKVIRQHKEQLIAGGRELKFTNMLVASLLASLDEIATVSTDPITRQLAEMAKERCNVDKLIHARQLLQDEEA
jgi:hypothetical protein